MRVVRTVAMAVNVLWIVLGLIVAFVALTTSVASLVIFMLVLIATAASSALVILRQWRGQAVARALRVTSLLLNAAWLLFATVGWTTAITGGPGPSGLESALPAALLTAMVLLNLVVILRGPGQRMERASAA